MTINVGDIPGIIARGTEPATRVLGNTATTLIVSTAPSRPSQVNTLVCVVGGLAGMHRV